MRLSQAAALIFILGSALPQPADAYYGARSTEAELTYQAQANIPWTRAIGAVTAASLNQEGAQRKRALEAVDAQVQHLMGTFQAASFQEKFGHPGVLGESYEIRFVAATPAGEASRLLVTYQFKGKVVFGKGAFSGPTRDVPLVLPLAADRIYGQTLNERGHNPCTDDHYNSEGDFWYFWDADQEGCPLKDVREDPVLRLKGKLKRLTSTRASYPEYDLLYGDNGNGKDVEASIFFGYIDDVESVRIPRRRDDAKTAFKFVERELKDRDFVLVESRDAFREYSNGSIRQGINFLRVYEKEITALRKPVKMRVKMLLTDTSIDSADVTFHRHLEKALEKSDIVIYDGHSGLGAYLDLALLPKSIRLNPSKYQIFYFNGCSSYPYFRGAFFDAKKGSGNLEIVTSGLPTYSDTSGPNAMAFLARFLDGETKTYQTILRELEESNAENGTYLTGVSGDEDNKWKPARSR